MPEFIISVITCNRASVASEKIFSENERERPYNANIGTKSGGGGICIDVSFRPKCKGRANLHHYTATLQNCELHIFHF